MNYVLIACDQLRYDTLSINGNSVCQTPNLDQLAREGVNFTNAHTTAPLCSPARASMFTGKYSLTHGMGTNCDMYHALSRELSHPETLLHHKLKQIGYACGYIGKWHVGTEIGPCDLGFEGMNIPGYGNCKADPDFLNYLEEHNLSYRLKDPIFLNPGNKTLAAAIWDGPEESTTDWYLTDRTIQLMENYRKEDKPYLVTCQYWGPHGPHTPPASYIGKADRSMIDQWKSFKEELETKPRFVRRHLDFYRNSPTDWEDVKEIIGRYYDYMMFIDAQIGRLIQHLKDTGQYEQTMIIFTSDHGDMQWSHNGLIDKGFLYEEAMRIPLIVRHPEISGGKVSDALVTNMDIFPTILDDAGISCACDGQTLFPIITGETKGRKEFLMEFHGIHFLYTQRAVIRRDGMKFIWTPGDVDELYDLNSDPEEIENLIANPNFKNARKDMIDSLKKLAVQYHDPVMDYIYKIFGTWENPSGQVDATSTRSNAGLQNGA
jgi:arylsulfatase A-like enzyme